MIRNFNLPHSFNSYGKNKIKVILRQFKLVILFLLKTRLKIIQNTQKFNSICKKSQNIRFIGQLFQKIQIKVLFFAQGSKKLPKGAIFER